MSTSAYAEHPVRSLISRILEMQLSPEFAEPNVAENEQYAFARDKVFAITHIIDGLLKDTPAELTSANALTQINSFLQSSVNELTSFLANKNPGHIINAASVFEQNVLPLMWGFLPKTKNVSGTSFAGIMESQAAISRETIRQISAQRDALAAKIQELTSQADAQILRLDTLTDGAAKERAEAAATVAKLEQVFAQKETERASTFDEAITGLKEGFKTFEASARTDSTTLLAELEEQRSQAARIVQVVGNIGVTGNYQQIANSEGTQANFWRWVTIAIFGTGIGIAVATFVKFWGEPFSAENTWSIVTRLLYAIAITAPAWYTARESARHRTTSDRARQTELELASIGPFIELLPEEKKVQIRENLTPIYFGKTVEAHAVNHPLDASMVKDMAIEMVKALKK